MHAAGFFADDLLSHHFVGAVESFEIYDAYQSIYPKAFVNFAEGCVTRMEDGQGKIVCVSNPGCNHMQTPRVGYDMPGQGKATMEFVVRHARATRTPNPDPNPNPNPNPDPDRSPGAHVRAEAGRAQDLCQRGVARLHRHQG